MKIGDKVKFLNDVGGGVVAGFQGKNIVLVEDEDGFQIPTAISDVVVEESDDYSTTKVVSKRNEVKSKEVEHDGRSVSSLLREGEDDAEFPDEEDDDPSNGEISYQRQPEERKEGNRLNVILAFVPMDIKNLSNTRFEVYLVNDCNYEIAYVYSSAEGSNWTVRQTGTVEPNTKYFIEEVGFEDLDAMQHLGIQMLAYKKTKPYVMKAPLDVRFRLNPIRFYKFHSFEKTLYFESPVLMFKLVEDDKPMLNSTIDAAELKRQMYSSASEEKAQPSTPSKRDDYVGRYPDNQRKGNKKHSPYYRYRQMDDTVVVDLHANEILETTNGMNNADILNYQLKVFRDTLSEFANDKGKKIVFIHGKGEGVLRRAIINELKFHYKRYAYQDASFQEYGYGATQVTIR
ncbi:MAG: DUF2027 domain-containing protein [Prevotella sp.]|jgi:hypothetical protein